MGRGWAGAGQLQEACQVSAKRPEGDEEGAPRRLVVAVLAEGQKGEPGVLADPQVSMSQQLLCRVVSVQPVCGQPWDAGLYRGKEAHMETGQEVDPL